MQNLSTSETFFSPLRQTIGADSLKGGKKYYLNSLAEYWIFIKEASPGGSESRVETFSTDKPIPADKIMSNTRPDTSFLSQNSH